MPTGNLCLQSSNMRSACNAGSGDRDLGKEQTSAPGKENSWGRGFRRRSGGDATSLPAATGAEGNTASVKPPRASGERASEVPRANGSQRQGESGLPTETANGSQGAAGPRVMDEDSTHIVPNGGKSVPWANGRPDVVPMDDIVEDTEEEED